MKENDRKNNLGIILTVAVLIIIVVAVSFPQSFWVHLSMKLFP